MSVHRTKRLSALLLAILLIPAVVSFSWATTRQEIHIAGTVESFGGYVFTPSLHFAVAEPGAQEIGKISARGIYNGEYPWIMRVYTDNLHFSGVAGAVHRSSPGGLVSRDGQFAIPLEIKLPVQDAHWRQVPDINDPDYVPYAPAREPGLVAYTDYVIMGIDPRNANWVAGPDQKLFTEDDNTIGDATFPTPFEIALRAEVPPHAAQGQYDGYLYIEIVPSP